MLIIDLKLALYLFLVLFGGIIWAVWQVPFFYGKTDTAVWNSFPFGVILLSRENVFRFANEKATQLLQAEKQSLQAADAYQQLVHKLQKDVATERFNLHLPADAALSVWSGLFGNIRLVILRDTGDQRRRERELQLFWGGISHELRTPLTSILAHAEVARSSDVAGEVQQQSLGIIQQQANRLVNLVQNALTLGRLKAADVMEKTAVNIILVAEEAVAELILLAESDNVAMSLACDAPLPRVLGNHDRLKQVFVVLLDNALKYCEPGDSIAVSLSAGNAHIRCQVADTGSGIPAEHLPHVTRQFYRARRDVVGSGLGLAIVQEIVRQHDGKLTIESESEGDQTGTCVTFTIPQASML